MKVLFNLFNVGLSNNGGSLTLVKSANELVKLGVDVKVIDSGKNQHTWSELFADHIIVNGGKSFPYADAVIATGMNSVESTLDCSTPIKLHWIRGWETWVYPEDKLVKILKDSHTIKLVNSICLEKKLRSYKISSYLIRPGYDFEGYYPTNVRSNKRIILGGIYNRGSKRSTKRTDWIFKCFSTLKDKYKDIELWMYGTDGIPDLVTYYKKDANEAEKNYIYNKVDIWLSPSELEGLHMPPAEAMLTECSVVTTNAEMSGTQDYIVHNQTGVVAENNIDSFIKQVSELLSEERKRRSLGVEARKKILQLGSRKDNMYKFLELIKVLRRQNDKISLEKR